MPQDNISKWDPDALGELGEIEAAIASWQMGSSVAKSYRDYPEDEPIDINIERADEIADVIQRHEFHTEKLIELWVGYVEASEGEGTEVSVEDFILATHIILKES